jgi:L,D-peptidoglycan transpeptidase YkuD (ErfK/YbiS/YcfS/YnhG family)
MGIKGMERQLFVRASPLCRTRGVVIFGRFQLPCALGRSGIRALKREGDGATPRGKFRVRQAFYRGDKVLRPRTGIGLRSLEPQFGWCDAPGDRNYNRFVSHPYPASAEYMWRDDELYDLVIVLGYNDEPRVQGRGSAVFMHVARAGFRPTEGCVALRRSDLLKLMPHLKSTTRVCIAM